MIFGLDPWLAAQLLVFLTLIGFFAGIIAGLLGVGGGIVLVPAFFFTFEMMGYHGPQLMQVCLATSLATIIFTSLKSVRSHDKRGAVDWAVLKGWALWIGLGSLIGVLAASRLHSQVLQLVFGVLGMVVALYLAFGRPEWRLGEAMPKGVARSVAGGVIGFLSVLMGIGGGSFGVPFMTLYGMPIHRAVATASGFGLIIALPSVLAFLLVPVADAPPATIGALNLPAFFVVIFTTYFSTPLGVRIAHATDPKPLKRIFAVFLMLMALNMLRKALGW